MHREINGHSSQPPSFGGPKKRTGSSPGRTTRSNTPGFNLFTLNDTNQRLEIELSQLQKEYNRVREQLQSQNTELRSTKQELEDLTEKRNRSNADENRIIDLQARVTELEKSNRKTEKEANEIINKVDQVENQSSKWKMAQAMTCEALMKIGGMFRWSTSPKADEKSTAPNEKGAVMQSYMYELTFTYITLLITMAVATAAYNVFDVKALSSIGTASLSVTPFCMGFDKTIISFHRQRLIMFVVILVYVYLFAGPFIVDNYTDATGMINTGIQLVLCKATTLVGRPLTGCDGRPKGENEGGTNPPAVPKDDSGNGDLIQYLDIVKESLLGPDSDFVFSLLCTTVGTTDIFLKNLRQQTDFCSSLQTTVVSALANRWDNQVSRHIFSILTAKNVRSILSKNSENKVIKSKQGFDDGFYIKIDLGTYIHSNEVFVKTSNSDMATRFLWFLRHVNGKSLIANQLTKLNLHHGEPHSIATTILKMIFGDSDGKINGETLLENTVKSILNGQDVDVRKYRVRGMEEIVEYMKTYPVYEQKLSVHTKEKAIELLKDNK